MTTASICTIGDEILIGQIIDTNSSHISTALGSIGVKVRSMVSFGDDHDEILTRLSEELAQNEIVITTGGLGPTKDDITKNALAQLSDSTSWYEHKGQMEVIENLLSSRGLQVLDINRAQALIPDKAEVIINRKGTAPILVFRFGKSRFGHDCTLYSMPGVPFETEAALPDVLDDIRAHFPLSEIFHKNIMTFGMAESALSKKIGAWEDALPEDMHLAYLPNPITGVRLRLSTYGGQENEVNLRMETQVDKLESILGDIIYAKSDTTLQATVGRILSDAGKTLSAAESCTGGMISSLITSVPGSSEYYLGSVTSYAISVKENVLGVPAGIIEKYNVVSSECVAAMAEGVRKLTGSDYAVSTSGIAGPGGGSDERPVGLVWVGLASKSSTKTVSFNFRNDRKRNIERFASSALNALRLFIIEDLKKGK